MDEEKTTLISDETEMFVTGCRNVVPGGDTYRYNYNGLSQSSRGHNKEYSS